MPGIVARPEVWDREADVVIIGFVAAGGCAALAAHDGGANVLVLEKVPEAGGNTRAPGGVMCAPETVEGTIDYFRALTWSEDNSAEVEKGWTFKADSLGELAEKLGVDPLGFAETVLAYNENCRQDVDPDFNRPQPWLVPLASPPFYGTELCEPIINTQGGPKHDRFARVVDN